MFDVASEAYTLVGRRRSNGDEIHVISTLSLQVTRPHAQETQQLIASYACATGIVLIGSFYLWSQLDFEAQRFKRDSISGPV